MMQLLCNGVFLDLYENANVQFTHDNPLFSFDELKCERTTNFKIPATPTNDRIFSLSKIPSYTGEGMRRKFVAQLQAGSVVRNGYLYVTSFDGKDYNAIFVTGELLGLLALKDAGKLADIMLYDEYVRAYQDIYFADNPALDNLLFAHMHYHGENGIKIQPSINVGMLVDKICTHLGVQCTGKPQGLYQMRLAVAELVLPKGENGHMHSVNTGGDPMNTIYPEELQRITISQEVLTATTVTEYHNGHNNPYGTLVETYTSEQTATHWKTLNNITIKFPEDLDEDYFLIMVNDLVPEDATFLGDYYFTKTVLGVDNIQTVVHGEPLAGRTVELTTGSNTIFLLVKQDDYVVTCKNTYIEVDDEPVAVTAVRRGWDFTDALNYDIEVYIEPQQSDAGTGDIVRLQDNLPAITFTELLKGIAAEYGLILSYNDADGIKFETLDFSTYPVVELKNLTKLGEVQRTFGKYAQRNRVVYKEDETFLTEEQTPIFYTIDNDNIERDKDLQVIPWTNGGFYSSVQGILVYDRVGRKEFMELRANPSWQNGDSLRAYIVKNTNLQSLCDASTQYKVSSRQSLLEYDQIDAKKLLLLNGTKYMWTSRNWQKDMANFTLAKIGAAATGPQPILPPDYQQVEYLENTSNSRILTGVTFNANDLLTVRAKFKWKRFNGSYNAAILGGYSQTTDITSVLITYSSRPLYLEVPNSPRLRIQNLGIINADTLYEIKLNTTDGSYVNGQQVTSTVLRGNNASASELYLYTRHGGFVENFIGEIYECEIEINGIAVRNFIPCYRKADNEPGMYDLVNNVFYTNVGGGAFVVGSDVNP